MSTPLDPAVKKAYEVSYALFRVAAILPSRNFAEMLEKEALNLLSSTVGNLPDETQKALSTIHYLMSLGKNTNNIHSDNADLIIQQLESLATMLRDRAMNSVTPADLSQIFTVAESRVAGSPSAESAKIISEPRIAESANSSNERQSIILERIRQSGNCRTRDLQAILPDLSERTLRYDLQRLIEGGRIERGGGGGPASWYKIKEANPQSNVSGGASL